MRQLNDALDLGLAGLVGRVRLAGIHHLKPAEPAGHGDQTLRMGEQQVHALVGRGAAREADRKDVWRELRASALADRVYQQVLRGVVRVDNLAFRNVNRVAQRHVVAPPARYVPVKHGQKRLRSPGGRVDAVGNCVDLVLGEHFPRHNAVLHGDAVDEARKTQCDIGHVEQSVVATAGGLQHVDRIGPEHPVGLLDREAIVPGWHWRVGGKYALLAHARKLRRPGLREGASGERPAYQRHR